MIYGEVKKFYREFEKSAGLNKRRGQRIGSTYFALPLYGRIPNVVGEGQTGMGKTISYLVPLAMLKLGRLPEVPKFVLEEDLYVEDVKNVDDLILEYAEEGDFEVDIDRLRREVVKPEVGKVYVFTATKMLQSQIVNKDLKTVNEFVTSQGGEPLRHVVLVGKKNYVCLKNVQSLEKEIERVIAEATKSKEVSEKDLNDFKEVLDILKIVEAERITTVDDGLKRFGRKKWDVLEQFLEEHDESIQPGGVLKGEAVRIIGKKATVKDLWKRFTKKNLLEGFFNKALGSQVTKCLKCSFRGECEFFKTTADLVNADVFIMNYHYFASHFINFLSSITKEARELEELLGIKIDKWNEKNLEKAFTTCREILEKEGEIVDKGDVKVAVKNALKFKKIYDTFVGKALFIFDEAHVFERDLLSSNTKSVDLSELYKNVQKVFNKLRDLDSLLDFGLSGMSSQARKRAERLMETGDVVLFRLKILKNLMEKTTNWMKDVWSRGEDLDVTDVAHAMMRFFFEEVKSGKDVYEKEALDVLESVWRKALAYEKKDYREVVNEAQKKAEEFLEVLKEEYSSGNGKSPEMGRKILSALLLTAFLEETKSTVQSMVEMISELRKDKNVVDESGVLSFYLYVQKFPKGRCFTIARDLAQISQFLKDHVAYTVAKLRLADADAYKNVAGEGGYLDKTYHPYWRMELYGFNKVNASLAEIKNRVSLDGFVINEIKNDVRGFLEEKLPQWRRLRKIFTSATLTDSGVGRKRKSSPSFNFFFRSVGLRYVDEDDCRTFVVLSPFNYGENALFYLPEDVPPFQEKNGGGASKEWREYVLEKMKEAPFYATGGTLVLLNSKEMLFWFYKELKDYYEKNGVQVLAQGFNSMKEINEKFGKPGAGPQILFSVQLYWQGFDVPGEGLQHVIIPKLPFEEPRSPYNVMVVEREVDRIAEFLMTKRNLPPLKAMEIATRSAFKSIVVPRAVLFFRQGIGRLIRTESDKGLVTLLDDRIVTKNYGKFFAKVIPMKYTRSFREVERFLDRHGIKGPYWGESGGRRVAIAMGMGR